MTNEATNKFMDKKEINSILETLRKEFPGAFPRDSFVILKKGIDLDILKKSSLKIGRTKLRFFLKIYTFHPSYKKLHVVGAKRHDLEGKSTGKVTADEVASLSKLQKLREQRKKFIMEQKNKTAVDRSNETWCNK